MPSESLNAQMRAMLYKAVRIHTKPNELTLHLLRLIVPLSLIYVTHLCQAKAAPHKGELAKRIAGMGWARSRRAALGYVNGFLEAGGDYAFALSALLVALLPMPGLAVTSVADRVSGIRFLLRSNGLSNVVYWASRAIDTVLVSALDLTVLTLGARYFNGRLVTQTSLGVLGASLLLLANAVAATSFMLGQLVSTKRTARSLSIALILVLVVVAPSLALYDEVVAANPLRVASTFGVASADRGGNRGAAAASASASASAAAAAFMARRSKFGRYMLALPPFAAFGVLHNLAMACGRGANPNPNGNNACLQVVELVWRGRGRGGGEDDDARGSDVALLLGLLLGEIVACWLLALCLDLSATHSHNRLSDTCEQEQQQAPSSSSSSSSLPRRPRLLARVENVSKTYFGGIRALDGVSFTVEEGACVGLLGPNGAGKSTLCKILTRQLGASSGAVSSFAMRANDFMGVCPQEAVLFDRLTVSEHLSFFAKLRGLHGDTCPTEAEAVAQFLDVAQLGDKARALPTALSGGTRRKLSVCLALIAAPGCFVLDEPTTGIDASSRAQIWAFVRARLEDGAGALVTTHMLAEAEALCTKLVIIRRGHVAETGTRQELKDKYGSGYFLNVEHAPQDRAAVKAYLASVLPRGLTEPVHASTLSVGQMVFRVGKDASVVGRLFCELDARAARHRITRWGVTQSTLDDAYNNIIGGAGAGAGARNGASRSSHGHGQSAVLPDASSTSKTRDNDGTEEMPSRRRTSARSRVQRRHRTPSPGSER